MVKSNKRYIFLIGSPRSGTTFLEDILDNHREIISWYEPYYLWESYFDVFQSDVWPHECLTKKNISIIRNEYNILSKKSGKSIIIDKSPYHAFNLDKIKQVFPDSNFIHIIRDGRDVTSSINREWKKRNSIVNDWDIFTLFRITFNLLARTPFLRYKLMAIKHEFSNRLFSNAKLSFNKKRWQGYPGWGPRFENWQEFLNSHSTLQFNAMQWVKSVEAVRHSWPSIADDSKIEVRYEDLLVNPEMTLSKILQFIGCKFDNEFMSSIPKIKNENFNKWKSYFSSNEIEEIKPILSPMLDELGYLEKWPW